jgi:hypothetical protein
MEKPMFLQVCFLIPTFLLMLGLGLSGSFAYREIPRLFKESVREDIQRVFLAELVEPGKYIVCLVTER